MGWLSSSHVSVLWRRRGRCPAGFRSAARQARRRPKRRGARRAEHLDRYFVVLELELPLWPLLLPEPLTDGVVVVLDWPEVLPEAAPLVEGVELLLPLAPPMLLPCALKWASHSEREIWPSLFLSTSLKLGVAVEAPAAADPLVAPDWLVVVPLDDMPEVLGVDCADVLGVDCVEVLGVAAEPLELEVCAMEAPESASSAEAVAPTRTFSIIGLLLCGGG